MIFRPRKHAHNLTVDLFDKTKHTLMKMWRLMKRGPDFPWIPFCYFCTKSTWICNGKWDDVTQTFFPLTATHYIWHLFLHQFFTLHFPLSFHIPPISTLISPHLFLSSILSLSVSLSLVTWDSVAILRDITAHTYCGGSVQVIMKCLGKED